LSKGRPTSQIQVIPRLAFLVSWGTLFSMQVPKSEPSTHFVYLLRCGNGTIYLGQTHDLSARFERHRSGTGARHTASIKPVEIIYQEGPMPFAAAVARERQIKKWSRAKKLALAKGDLDRLRELSRGRHL
jgi:predicted GIY-YIG superfamily endonuclease